MKKLILGSFVSTNRENKYLLGVVEETIANGADCFMIFIRPPFKSKLVPLEEFFVKEARKLAATWGINFSNCIVHADFFANLTWQAREGTFYHYIIQDIYRMVSLGIKYFVIQPGYFLGTKMQDLERKKWRKLKLLIRNIKEILQETKELDYYFLLETTSFEKDPEFIWKYKRYRMGHNEDKIDNFGNFREIFESCNWDPKLGLCLNTAHLYNNGYDLSDIEALKNEIENSVGLKRVKAIYLADAQNEGGNYRDKYANLGYGHIGFETLMKWAYDEYFSTLPIIVETPHWRKKKVNKNGYEEETLVPPYQHEIQLIRKKAWKPIPDRGYRVIYNRNNLSVKGTGLILGVPALFTKSNQYLLGAVKKTVENRADCFVITSECQESEAENVLPSGSEQFFLREAKELAEQFDIEFSNCIATTPPDIFNLASVDEECNIKVKIALEIEKAVSLGMQYFVIEPGYYPQRARNGRVLSSSERLKYLIENTREILEMTKHLDYFLLLETMSDENNQLGVSFEEFQKIFEGCNWDPKLGLCLNTAALHNNGHNLWDIEALKREIENTVGMNRVKAIYLLDSNNRGSKGREIYEEYGKDIYANLGNGHIGFETLMKWAYDDYFSTLPIIVETPRWKERIKRGNEKEILISPYKHDIQLIRKRVWKQIPT